MTDLTHFTVYGIAKPKGSTRGFKPPGSRFVTITDSGTGREWSHQVFYEAEQILRLGKATRYPTGTPVALAIEFYLPCPKSAPKRRVPRPTKKPDLDKLVRNIGDALTRVLYDDDSQVTTLTVRKRYAGREEDPSRDGRPRAEIRLCVDPVAPSEVLMGESARPLVQLALATATAKGQRRRG